MIAEVSAELTIRRGKGDAHVMKPEPEWENGTGFLIHPDGWIATIGHLLEPTYAADEDPLADLPVAAGAACRSALARVPESERTTSISGRSSRRRLDLLVLLR
jgi:hypothetical protein